MACCAARCIGATVEGNIDYARDQVAMRGTLVPLYGLNNMFGQMPIVGLFLGGEQRGHVRHHLRGGRHGTSNPRTMRQSDLGDRAGVLRKFFEFRETPDQGSRLRRADRFARS